MVEHGAVDRLGRGRKSASGAAVSLAGRRIAAWVIMRKHDTCAAVRDCVGKNVAKREDRSGFVSVVA